MTGETRHSRNTLGALSALLIAALLCARIAHGAPTLALGSADTAAGQTFSVPVSLSNDSAVATLQFDIQYDATQLTPGEPTIAGVPTTTQHGVAWSDPASGVRRIVVAPPRDNTAIRDGVLVVTVPPKSVPTEM